MLRFFSMQSCLALLFVLANLSVLDSRAALAAAPAALFQDEDTTEDQPDGAETPAAEDDFESGDGSAAPAQPVEASDEGQQAIAGFRVPAGMRVKLFAAEPLVANPVAMTVDNRGRVYVCESFRQDRGVTDNRGHDREWLLADLAAQSVDDRIAYHLRLLGPAAKSYIEHDDRIRRLVDTDGDGQADEATVFASGFNGLEEGTGAGVLVRGDTAYYTCIPMLWLLRDADDDGRAEVKTGLHHGYGVRVAFRGHDSHGLVLGPDGRLYFSIGDRGYNIETADGRLKDPESGAVFRCELDGSRLEVFATGLRNPQELAFDDYGYLFTGDNNSDSGDKARWVNVMQGGDSGWRMMYQYIPDRGPFNREKIWQPFSADTPAYIVPPIANIGDGPAGLTAYPGTGLSGDYENCFFMVDFRGGPANSGIRLIRTQPRGAFWDVERSEEFIWQILATDAEFGPDGALWACDWVDGWVGEGKGRIYRFVDEAAQEQEIVQEVASLLSAGFSQRSADELAILLKHRDRRIRLEAQWELAHRGTTDGFMRLIAEPSAGTLPRLHAVWGLGQAARLNGDLLEVASAGLRLALADKDMNVRATAAQVVGDLRLERFSEQVLTLLSDEEPRVRYAAGLTVGALGLSVEQVVEPLRRMLAEADGKDPGLRHAAIMALTGASRVEQVVALKQHADPAIRLAAVVALRKRLEPAVAEFLLDDDPAVQLEAARAVHDVPELHAGLQQLAGLLDQSEVSLVDAALAHRVLNANFRLGTEQSAAAIARFAANDDHSDAMRMEALRMLATWEQPGQLDRVMNRWMPIEVRSPAAAVEAFTSNLQNLLSGSELVLNEAIEAASQLKIEGAAALLEAIAIDASMEPRLRNNALSGLNQLAAKTARPLIERLTMDASPLVRGRALELLAEVDPEKALPLLKERVQAAAVVERQAAWDALAKLPGTEAAEIIVKGIDMYLQGAISPDVWLNVVAAAEKRLDTEQLTGLKEYQQQAAEGDKLEAYRTSTFGGDPEAGRQLFFTRTELSCVRCHKVGGVGGEVGPDLTEIGKTKDNRYLLESIVDPDAQIAQNFESVMFLTEDDEIVTGILRKETPALIELIDADGKLIELDPLSVVSRRKGKSAMPADLIKYLDARELRDLVAYLSSLK